MNRTYTDKYGIGITKWCREYEKQLEEALSSEPSGDELARLLASHEKRLSYLMHERLIHLIVVFITVILVLFSIALILFCPETMPASLPMFLILFVLLVFYIRHYFFLENTVQHWYRLTEEIENMICTDPW